ncbi:MAG: methyltransferase domain-containing protein [Desulfobacteraceae bacterium]|nr:methyltransferase domain-containing protein [Desulfobacteraceae bacterium]
MDTLVYIMNFIKDRNVASITPTSSVGVKRVCDKIDFNRENLIVEYGPGTGVFSRYLLKNMGEESRLILIERNKNFNSILRNKLRDPRVFVVQESAENVLDTLRSYKEEEADYIISGIPFSFLDSDLKHRILYNTHRALKKGGKFLVYQTCFQTNNHLKVHLQKYFPIVHSKYELVNIPPLRIFEAIK